MTQEDQHANDNVQATAVRTLANRILLECRLFEQGEVPSIVYADILMNQGWALGRIARRIANDVR